MARVLVVLSSIAGETDRVAAFEAGVDDYVVKPHGTRELLLRVRALSRTRSEPPKVESLSIGRLRIDVAARQAWIDHTRLDMTRRELDVLIRLAERAARADPRGPHRGRVGRRRPLRTHRGHHRGARPAQESRRLDAR